MKTLILILAMIGLTGCGSTPKILMKNCEKLKSGFYECEPVEKNMRDYRGRQN